MKSSSLSFSLIFLVFFSYSQTIESDYIRLESTINQLKSNNNKIIFKDKVSILSAKLDKSEDLLNQISESISDSGEAKEVKDLAMKLLYKYARQELGGE